MEHTDEQRVAFKAEFAKRKKRQLALAAPFLLLIVAFFLLTESAEPDLFGVGPAVWAPIFFLMIAAALFFSFKNWRCPACDKYLGKQFSPRFCPHCGIPLR